MIVPLIVKEPPTLTEPVVVIDWKEPTAFVAESDVPVNVKLLCV